jgi:hypothetical protein
MNAIGDAARRVVEEQQLSPPAARSPIKRLGPAFAGASGILAAAARLARRA